MKFHTSLLPRKPHRVPFTTTLPVDVLADLKQLSTATGYSQGDVIVLAVHAWLEDQRRHDKPPALRTIQM